MLSPRPETKKDDLMRQRAVARWENEGGAIAAGNKISKMSDKKDKERKVDSDTVHLLSQVRRNKEKSEAKNHAKEDKRRVAREEHINGSTPKSSL